MPTTTLKIPTADGGADAVAASPEGGGRHPGVLLYMDAFGLRPALERMAEELAGHGYYVLVPNVFHRHGPAPVVDLPPHIGNDVRPAVFAGILPLMEAHTPARAEGDAAAYLDFLTARPEVAAGPVAVVGYCMGAALALRTAAAHPGRVAAVAGFHPAALVTDAPDSPHRLVGDMDAEVYFGLAENDMTPEAAEELGRALDAAGVTRSIEVYPGTVHGFTMSDTDAFDASARERHWDRLLPLLARNLTV
ncbi:dienelactone hydrolase family protein [uncultured Streptomyces sp.]|uniref:dienelactone hydrolase family protein n=1 Tax=uncultured Streptomyces sp. TaxID=174707 RepID=UPI0026175D82|nr:dienelactone hydrolase family protein [uncultured Streptomyces sp.]